MQTTEQQLASFLLPFRVMLSILKGCSFAPIRFMYPERREKGLDPLLSGAGTVVLVLFQLGRAPGWSLSAHKVWCFILIFFYFSALPFYKSVKICDIPILYMFAIQVCFATSTTCRAESRLVFLWSRRAQSNESPGLSTPQWRVFCMCLHTVCCFTFIIDVLPCPVLWHLPDWVKYQWLYENLTLHSFLKTPSLIFFLLLPWEQDHDGVPEALIILYSQFLTPAQVVIVPFFFSWEHFWHCLLKVNLQISNALKKKVAIYSTANALLKSIFKLNLWMTLHDWRP